MATTKDTIDLKHLPDWRRDPRYVEAAAKLDALRRVLPDLDTAEAHALLAATSAQDDLDQIETLAIAGRAKERDIAAKRAALETANTRLAEATRKREAATRQQRLLENGLALICDDVRAEVAQELSAVAQTLMARLEAVMREAVETNEEYRRVQEYLRVQFPGYPADARYAAALGMPLSPWNDLRPEVHGKGFISETAYTNWQRRFSEARAAMPAYARPGQAAQKAS